MEAIISKPKERTVTLRMTESEAEILRMLAPNIRYQQIINFGGNHGIAMDGDRLFAMISIALREMRDGGN